ncbi:MAG: DUF192 domain-containing protein [Nitrosopumilus sp.]|nr:DUF192 domain-containing protein [Nitrosopumilus sp.]
MFTFKISRNDFYPSIVLLCAFSIFFPTATLVNLNDNNKIFAQNDDSNDFSSSVKIKGLDINVILAETPDQKTKGLSVKNSLKENEGMLFIFDSPRKNSFWMKDMKFPIDIIWINSDYRIIHIEKNLPPCTSFLICKSYSPDENSQYVLEVNSNYTTKNNITVGDKVEFDIVNLT